MAYAYKNKLETRALVGNALVILVGLGSVAFHATLLYDLQMWDEIPMVWLILSWYYGLWTLNSPPGRTNRWLVFILVFYGLLCTGVHYNGAYTVAFQLHFALITVVAGMILVFKWWNRGKDPRFGFMIPLLLLSISIAMTCWIIDQTLCNSINASLPFNPQFHAIWHLFCSVTLHFGVQYTTALRMLFLKQKVTKKDILGLPFVISSDISDKLRS
eukprot:TRINITY_DN4274_c0_g1_i10.p1 TRINITY_DN4274_c0_g1~~TRINITY_DN4274_c0_g1_i10.p1  ORF type:complete len:215 (+),score=19.22 TRINITY_DN4274_c0_g1_i10:231-875(+)